LEITQCLKEKKKKIGCFSLHWEKKGKPRVAKISARRSPIVDGAVMIS
jgi:hypothetical protein